MPEDLVHLAVHEHQAARRGVADGDADRRLLEHRLDLAPLGVLLGGEPLGRLPDAHVLRHLDAHDRHTLDDVGRIAQRLQHEGEDALGRRIRPVEPHVILVGVLRLPRDEDPVDQLGKAVAGKLRQRLADGPADQRTAPDHLQESWVGRLEAVGGPAEHGIRDRRLLEHLPEPALRPRAGLRRFGRPSEQHDRSDVLQLMGEAAEAAVGLEDGSVGGAPVPLFR